MAEISQLLKDTIEQRMSDLGLSPTDLAARTGLTQQALLNVRNGKRRRYQPRLTGPLCRVLGWKPDGIKRLLAGQEPEMLDGHQPGDVDEIRQMLAALSLTVQQHSSELAKLAADRKRSQRKPQRSAAGKS